MTNKSLHESIREGLAEVCRKANDYDNMKKKLETELAEARAYPHKFSWDAGFDSGYELARRAYSGEYNASSQRDEWERFLGRLAKGDNK